MVGEVPIFLEGTPMQRYILPWLSILCLIGSLSTHPAAQGGYKIVSLQGPGSGDTEPFGIQNNGTVTGYYADANGTYHGFTSQSGTFTMVDVPSSLNAQATYLYAGNALGQVAGGYADSQGNYQGAIYNSVNQSWTYLPSAGPTSQLNLAGSINNSGVVFGNTSTDPTGASNLVGYVFRNGTYSFFTAPGSNAANGGTDLFGSNNAGTVVGYYFDDLGSANGFLRRADGTILTLNVPNAINTELFGINDSGEVVGTYLNSNGIANGFTYTNGIFATVDVSGALNTYVTGVDNNGDLVGYTTNDRGNGPYEGFIGYSVVPEPSSIIMYGIACAIGLTLAGTRRKQIAKSWPEKR